MKYIFAIILGTLTGIALISLVHGIHNDLKTMADIAAFFLGGLLTLMWIFILDKD